MSTAPRPSPKPVSLSPGDPAFDPAALRKLVVLAGPDAALLLRQLTADLGAERDRLTAGANGPDMPGLRRAAHGIVALAGTAGEGALAQLARSLHDTACDAAPVEPVLRLALRVASGVERLIGAITAEARRLGLDGPLR